MLNYLVGTGVGAEGGDGGGGEGVGGEEEESRGCGVAFAGRDGTGEHWDESKQLGRFTVACLYCHRIIPNR